MNRADYLRDSNASKYILCENIMQYYKDRGYPDVKAWVETEMRPNGDKVYVVRSDLRFSVTNFFKQLKRNSR